MEANAQNRAVTAAAKKRRFAIAAIAILLLLMFLLRPGVSRLKTTIAGSLSRAVGRPVEIGSVHLRFLPPGFDLENLVVEEDPQFGAEPMLRASEVTAYLRLTSLLRGRLDISRLELTEPSLNLVRTADGKWNLESLLERTAHAPLAPTAKSKMESRPGFPYIEATSGRINFKAGQVKKPYALLNADFALWQDSENAWGVRLRAEPLRTDMNLNDAGLLRLNGSWQRAENLRDTPLQFSLQWDRVQLGQLTKLISGTDRGWRGAGRLNATLSGTPSSLQVSADTGVDDFHRYDIPSAGNLRLRAHCDARYSSLDHVAHEIFCNAPVGAGMVSLHGDAGVPGVHRVRLSLDVENVPANAAAQLALRVKKNLPAGLIAAGLIRGNVVIREDGKTPHGAEFQGSGEISDLQLQSAGAKAEFAPATMPLVLTSSQPKNQKQRLNNNRDWQDAPAGVRLEYGPFPISLGHGSSLLARGWVARSAYRIAVTGSSEVSRALRLADLFGLPAIRANAEGMAQVDLFIAGSIPGNISEGFNSFLSPQVMGKAQLRNVRATVRGVNAPIEIAAAELELLPEEARVEALNARAGNAHWTGNLRLPRNCGTAAACIVQFDLRTEQLSLGALREWLQPPVDKRRWYQVLAQSDDAPPPFLRNLRASGKLSAARLQIHNLTANRVSASLQFEKGHLKVSDLRADLLGGKNTGEWEIDFASGTPQYSGRGSFTSISLDQVANAMHDGWISGNLNGRYEIRSSGADFWKSLDGRVQFDLQNALLQHLTLAADDPPFRIDRWRGNARVHNSQIELEKASLVSPLGACEISGTASLGRILDLQLIEGAPAKIPPARPAIYSITGTIAEPRVVLLSTPETRAALKPDGSR